VWNQRRWSPATDVQVFLLSVEKPAFAGGNELVWAGEVPLQWRNQQINPLVRVIGAPAECDLCNVVKEKWLELTTVIEILALQRIYREECHLTLTLQAKAQQSDSKPLRIELHWYGHWSDGVHDMRALMAVKTVPVAPAG
jgi:hypothetical protein